LVGLDREVAICRAGDEVDDLCWVRFRGRDALARRGFGAGAFGFPFWTYYELVFCSSRKWLFGIFENFPRYPGLMLFFYIFTSPRIDTQVFFFLLHHSSNILAFRWLDLSMLLLFDDQWFLHEGNR
jgi:hypothetical protein